MKSFKRRLLRGLKFILVPVLFVLLGYGTIYVIGRPVITFVSSTLNLFLLAEVPTFTEVEAAQLVKMTSLEKETSATKTLASSQIDYPAGGQYYGQLDLPSVELKAPLYFGDSQEILRLGAGQYMGSVFPGETGTTMIGGHNLDGFAKMNGLKLNDPIHLATTYGRYTYRVIQTEVHFKKDQEIEQILEQSKEHLLILYTCYQEYSFGLTDNRLFVVAKLTSGPLIDQGR